MAGDTGSLGRWWHRRTRWTWLARPALTITVALCLGACGSSGTSHTARAHNAGAQAAAPVTSEARKAAACEKTLGSFAALGQKTDLVGIRRTKESVHELADSVSGSSASVISHFSQLLSRLEVLLENGDNLGRIPAEFRGLLEETFAICGKHRVTPPPAPPVTRVTVHSQTVTQTQTATPAASSEADGAEGFYAGNGTKSLGTVTVSEPSVIHWHASGGFFAILGETRPSEHSIAIASRAAGGESAVEPGTYHEVSVDAFGEWGFTITSQG